MKHFKLLFALLLAVLTGVPLTAGAAKTLYVQVDTTAKTYYDVYVSSLTTGSATIYYDENYTEEG